MFALDDRGNNECTLSLGEADFASRSLEWRRFAAAVVATVILITMSCAVVNGQTETGQISGKVTDQQNGVLANASVTVKSMRTAVERTTATNAEGVYTVTNLQPGTYDVTVSGGGFAPSRQRVEVTVGGKSSADVQVSLSD